MAIQVVVSIHCTRAHSLITSHITITLLTYLSNQPLYSNQTVQPAREFCRSLEHVRFIPIQIRWLQSWTYFNNNLQNFVSRFDEHSCFNTVVVFYLWNALHTLHEKHEDFSRINEIHMNRWDRQRSLVLIIICDESYDRFGMKNSWKFWLSWNKNELRIYFAMAANS